MTGDYHALRHEMTTALRVLESNLPAGMDLHINSGYRADKDSSHETGLAADIKIRGGWERRVLVKTALDLGWERIGVYDHHVHLDLDPNRPRPVLWTGISK